MRFLVDAQLPPALAHWLVSRGYHAEHVADRGLDAADDRAVWRHAAATGAVIVTKDEDFALIRTMEQEGPAVLWIRLGNSRRRELLRWFERILPSALKALERGARHSEMASRTLSRASSLVRPWLTQPGIDGHSAIHTPSNRDPL